jgi:DNA invertase Pin-like site-specific DNA recombinase
MNSKGSMKKIALYLRVSTDRQATDSQALELREYCSRRGWTGVAEYCDTASGAKFSREGLDALESSESVAAKHFDGRC